MWTPPGSRGTRAVDGLAIGPSVGSCGTAAYRREPVYVSDIAGDPLWAPYAEFALSHGLRACWSSPILSSDAEVLGTFAMYYRQPRQPTARDLRTVDIVTRTVAIAIEQSRAEQALRESEERFRGTFENAAVGIAHVEVTGRFLRVNEKLCDITGYGRDELLAKFRACLDFGLNATGDQADRLADAIMNLEKSADAARAIVEAFPG